MSIAITIGRGIGYAAAATAHGAIVAANSTGQFGKDLATGTTTGYADHKERLAALRAARPALALEEVKAAMQPVKSTKRRVAA